MSSPAPRNRVSRIIQLVWLLEMALLMLAVTFAAKLRFFDNAGIHPLDFLLLYPIRTALVAFAITGAMAAFGLYQPYSRLQRTELLLRLTLSFGFGGVGLFVLYYLVPQSYIGRGVLAMALGLGFIGVVAARYLVLQLFGAQAFKRRVLVYGAGRNANLINTRLRRVSDRRAFLIVGFLPISGQAEEVEESQLVRSPELLQAVAERLGIHEIVVAPDERRGGLPMEQLLACAQRGIAVTDLTAFFEREAGKIKLSVLNPSTLVFSGGFDHSLPRRLSKRAFDIAAAIILLLLAWPAMLLVALAIFLESGAPVLYRQVRVGQSGRDFSLIKFRSMRTDAEKNGAQWAQKNDDRITRVGHFIRLTRLDELPQLFNVLSGDMSFVGPRPERPQFVDQLCQEIRYYDIRHSVKPGLTGWAQLRYPYGASVKDAEEKLKFDLFYVKNQGLILDLMILLQTVEVVMFRRGAR